MDVNFELLSTVFSTFLSMLSLAASIYDNRPTDGGKMGQLCLRLLMATEHATRNGARKRKKGEKANSTPMLPLQTKFRRRFGLVSVVFLGVFWVHGNLNSSPEALFTWCCNEVSAQSRHYQLLAPGYLTLFAPRINTRVAPSQAVTLPFNFWRGKPPKDGSEVVRWASGINRLVRICCNSNFRTREVPSFIFIDVQLTPIFDFLVYIGKKNAEKKVGRSGCFEDFSCLGERSLLWEICYRRLP